MKNMIIAGMVVCLLVGCSSTSKLLTPAALTSEVATGVSVGLDVYPAATPEVKIARDVICAEVGRSNVQPAAIVADLTAAGITNSNSKLIVDGALLVYNGVFTLLGTNVTLSAAQPYLNALCDGLTQGIPSVTAARRLLPPHLK